MLKYLHKLADWYESLSLNTTCILLAAFTVFICGSLIIFPPIGLIMYGTLSAFAGFLEYRKNSYNIGLPYMSYFFFSAAVIALVTALVLLIL